MTCIYPKMPEFKWNNRYFYIGLTGAIGSGKSTVTRIFQEHGAIVYDADKIAKSVLHSTHVRPNLHFAFGDNIFNPDNSLNITKLATLVFSDQKQLDRLNMIIHPHVQKKMQFNLKNLKKGSLCVYDIPLLFETNQQKNFDCIIVVSAPKELRLERVKKRSNWSLEEFQKREKSQMPLMEKEKLADLVINNTENSEELETTIKTVCKKIQSQNM